MSFHKPRVYRSAAGCCICKAKSSSSRFTDCEKYKDAFGSCFKLTEDREGDICNACVLLVKRFRKLPKTSKKHWSHVVDARAGPGVKSFVKRNKVEKPEVVKRQKHVYKRKHRRKLNYSDADGGASTGTTMDTDTRQTDSPANRQTDRFARQTDSPLSTLSDEALGSDGSRAHTPVEIPRSRAHTPVEIPRTRSPVEFSRRLGTGSLADALCGFFDSSLWKREETCCGAIFRGPFGEVMIDRRFHRPCSARLHQTKAKKTARRLSDRQATSSATPATIASPATAATSPLDNTKTAAAEEALTAVSLTEPADRSVRLTDLSLLTGEDAAAATRMDVDGMSASSKSSTAATPTSFESLIESELKAFGLESETSHDEEENIDFYCNETLTDLKAGPVAHTDDIDEGFFDKPTSRQEKSLRISCESPSFLSL